ncbi:MAG TPA: L-threonylcarbamoyladenylate synthase [Terracidiphilus sp.]|nr:L-threonylcarbamoyladenylate synthase [Terracidiphilus sp.]
MKTLRLKVDPGRLDSAEAGKAIDRAAAILRAGGLVAFPTETVYGLGANALDADAVGRIFAAKRRPTWDPIIVHIAPAAGQPSRRDVMLGPLVHETPDTARRLMEAFWPGPLTLLLPRSASVPEAVTAGRALVGVRMPSHPVALELIRRAGVPVAAPSANVFGHISPTTAEHVLHDLDGRIDVLLDAGPTEHGVESTVLDPTQSPMVIYRPGAVTAEQIREVAGEVTLFHGGAEPIAPPTQSLAAPGLGLRHYAPNARLVLIEAGLNELGRELARVTESLAGEHIGVLLPTGLTEMAKGIDVTEIYEWGSWHEPEELARNLYAGLRKLDVHGCTVILCPLPPGEGIGAAIRDRLRKAAHPETRH